MMKLSVIQVMIVSVFFAASQSQCDFLKLIHEDAVRLLANLSKTELEETTLAVASESPNKCWKGFFCRAEKSLEAANLPNLHDLKKLMRHIEQYNKNHSVNCVLKKNTTNTLKIFLTEVEECTRVFNNSRRCVYMKTHEKA